MAISQAKKVGIIVERRESDNQWIDHTWQAVSIIPGVPDMDQSGAELINLNCCLLYTSPSPRDGLLSRMPSSA